MNYTVTVTRQNRHSVGIVSCLTFTDEKKAHDHYTDCLVKYPDYNVEILPSEK